MYKSVKDSQERYSQRMPILSFRIEREVYDKLKEYERQTGQKPKHILRNFFHVKSTVEKEHELRYLAHELGYELKKKNERGLLRIL